VFMAVIFFLAGSFIIVSSVTAPTLREIQNIRTLQESKKSFYYSESGIEDASYRLKFGVPIDANEEIIFDNGITSTTIVSSFEQQEVTSVGNRYDRIRTSYVLLIEGTGGAFFYGVQTGDGGILMENTSEIIGSAFSNGPIKGSGNRVRGDVISTESDGLIDNINADTSMGNSGTAYANTIQNSDIDGDAYFQTISNTTVDGTEFPGSPDQPRAELPIPDSAIDQWELDAEAGGVIRSTDPECSGGKFTINSSTTTGPIKIECDLEITGSNVTVTLAGAVWVVGDIKMKIKSIIRIDPAVPGKSIPMIADNPLDRENSSTISLENSTKFEGAGDNSYVLLVSYNTNSESTLGMGSIAAITVQQSVEGDLLVYAGHGEILLKNSVKLIEASGYKLHLRNSTEVIFETGLRNLIFTSGPSGGFVVDKWEEIE